MVDEDRWQGEDRLQEIAWDKDGNRSQIRTDRTGEDRWQETGGNAGGFGNR